MMDESELVQVELVSADGVALTGEIITPTSPRALVVLCHGIPLSRPDPSDAGYPALARGICEAGYATLFMNFRGTGGSGGDFSIAGWYRDLEAVMEFAVSEHAAGRFPALAVAGFSAGGSLAIRYAAEHGGACGIAAFAAPADFTGIFPRENLFAFLELAKEVGIIRSYDYPPDPFAFYGELEESAAIDFVGGVSPASLLLVHGDADDMVPLDEGRRLIESALEPKELVVLPGGGHRLRHDSRSLECLVDWLERVTASG